MAAFVSAVVRLLGFLEECPARDYCCTGKEAGAVIWILPLGQFEQDQEIRIILYLYFRNILLNLYKTQANSHLKYNEKLHTTGEF